MEPENDESSKIRTHDFGSRKRQISPQLFAVVEIWFLIPLNVLGPCPPLETIPAPGTSSTEKQETRPPLKLLTIFLHLRVMSYRLVRHAIECEWLVCHIYFLMYKPVGAIEIYGKLAECPDLDSPVGLYDITGHTCTRRGTTKRTFRVK